MSVSPSLDIYFVSTAVINSNKLAIPIRNPRVHRLRCIDQNYAKRMGFKTHKLEKLLQAYNMDGTKNK